MKHHRLITLCLVSALVCSHLTHTMDKETENAPVQQPGFFSRNLTKLGDNVFGHGRNVLKELRDNKFDIHIGNNTHRLNHAINQFRNAGDHALLKELLAFCQKNKIDVDSKKTLEDTHAYLAQTEKEKKGKRIQLAQQTKDASKTTISEIATEMSKCVVAGTTEFTAQLNDIRDTTQETSKTTIEKSKTTLDSIATTIALLQKGKKLTTEVGQFKSDDVSGAPHQVVYPDANNTGVKQFLATIEHIKKLVASHSKQLQNLLAKHIQEKKPENPKKALRQAQDDRKKENK